MQQAPAMSMEFYIEDNGAEEIRWVKTWLLSTNPDIKGTKLKDFWVMNQRKGEVQHDNYMHDDQSTRSLRGVIN
jgi:hypothetical protein